MGKFRFIDLSISLADTPPGSYLTTEITYLNHEQGAEHRRKVSGLPRSFFLIINFWPMKGLPSAPIPEIT